MKRQLVEEVIVHDKEDGTLSVFDGTSKMHPKGKYVLEVIVDGDLYYCPYVGLINKKDFPDLINGEVRDKQMIDKIVEKIY